MRLMWSKGKEMLTVLQNARTAADGIAQPLLFTIFTLFTRSC